MLERHHDDGRRASSALYSDCATYRYALTRTWDPAGARLLYVMLNPSRATETQNDPTIERCERRAKALGFGAFRAVNLFAYRETDPIALRRAPEPVGPDNDIVLIESATRWLRGAGDHLLCGWGVHGAHLDRGAEVAEILQWTGRQLFCFGTTKNGAPRHPLYIAYATAPQLWLPSQSR